MEDIFKVLHISVEFISRPRLFLAALHSMWDQIPDHRSNLMLLGSGSADSNRTEQPEEILFELSLLIPRGMEVLNSLLFINVI